MSNYLTSSADLTSVANAIRSHFGFSSSIEYPAEFVSTILGPNDHNDAYWNGALSGIISGNLSSIPDYTFQSMSGITGASFPECERIGLQAFGSCTGLVSAYFQGCLNVGQAAFSGCTNLSVLSLPNVQTLGGYNTFDSANNLKTLSLPKLVQLSSNTFARCGIMSLYLMGSSYVSMSAYTIDDVFPSSPLSAGGSGTIYVPTSMLATYKSMFGWSIISARFRGI